MSRCFASVAPCVLVGCVRATAPAAVVSLPLELPAPAHPVNTASQKPAVEERSELDFSSDRGLVHLRMSGAQAAGRYTNGVLVCGREQGRLECEWAESNAEGRATFTARPDGGFDGTWGNGASAVDNGAWSLRRITTSDVDGLYDSNWGPATVTQTQAGVRIDYERGTMTCSRTGGALDCRWSEGAQPGGGAELAIEPNGILRGRWGSGSSSSDGGSWIFVKR